MPLAQSLLAEFESQAPVTRKFLERLPDEKLEWRPHQKSMTAGQLALHLAQIPGGLVTVAAAGQADVSDFGAPQPSSREEILKAYDESVETVRRTLPTLEDAQMALPWRLTAEGREILAIPRADLLRSIMLNHWYQHRGQMSVYLRLLDIPVPSSFGPSADEAPSFL